MRVLVVSEDPAERRRVCSALGLRPDVEVIECSRAAEVRGHEQLPEVDVLVIDGDLRPKGGFSVLYEIRAEGELVGRPTPPAIVLVTREQDRWLSSWAGANRTIAKPVDPFELAAAVTELAGARPAERDPSDESGLQVTAAVDAEGSTGGLTP